MSTTETLFGGMFAVAVIFFVGRRCSLSNFWSAVLAGVLPFLAFLGYTANAWPSGDVLAIHLVLYIATAAVLAIFNNMRQGKSRMHWAPKILIGFFVTLILINAVLLSIATNGLPESVSRWFMPEHGGGRLHTGFTGAIPHDQNRLYEAHQQRIAAQQELGWQVDVRGLERLQAGHNGRIDVSLRDAQGKPLKVERVRMEMWRLANRKDDGEFELQQVGSGLYRAEVTLPAPGNWVAVLDVDSLAGMYQTQYPLQVAP